MEQRRKGGREEGRKNPPLHHSTTPSLQFLCSYQIDLFAFPESHDRLFPMRLGPVIGAAFALFFAGVIAGVDIDNFLLEQALDRVLDLNLVRAWTDAEDVLVLLLAQQRRFFRQ